MNTDSKNNLLNTVVYLVVKKLTDPASFVLFISILTENSLLFPIIDGVAVLFAYFDMLTDLQ
jgi:hypothetical protein